MAKKRVKSLNINKLINTAKILTGWIIAPVLIVVMYLYSPQLGLWLISDKSDIWFNETATMLQDFLTITLSIVIEALPFVILGIIISSLIRRFLPPAKLTKILPRNPFWRRFTLSLAGLALPVCECGNVPVARSLLARRTDSQSHHHYCNNDRFQFSALHDLVANYFCIDNRPTDRFDRQLHGRK